MKVHMYRFYADREYVANKDNKFKETNYNRIVNLLSFMLMEESRKVCNLEHFIHGFVIFLYLHLNMGVSGNLVVGFI